MKSNLIKAIVCVWIISSVSACAELKHTGKTIGHATRDMSRSIGHTSRDAAKSIGKDSKSAAHKVKRKIQDS